jgi:flagellar L-ring protein precursor FlgH
MSVLKKIVVRSGVVFLLYAAGASAASLYQENNYQALSSDRKAHQRGDLITVMVYENASATSTANTNAARDAGAGLDFNGFGRSWAGNAKTNNQFDGSGRTQREGKVVTQITVSVKDIASNGDLIIGGEHFLEVNNERQHIKIEGRIRKQDISDTNTVLSTRIADARISYSGEGDVADRQRSPWWLRLLLWFGL